ncbi:MAG: helix-turn-helix transcriptional regulator [Bdellovibrionales bacterium]
MTQSNLATIKGRFLGERETRDKTNLSRSTRYRLEMRGEFPQRRQLSPGRVGWLESEVDAWLAARSGDTGGKHGA